MNQAAPAPSPFSGSALAGTPRPAFGIGPDGTYTRAGQVLAFLCGLWTMALFFPLLFPAAILYTRSEEVFQDDPGRARKLVQWSWLCITLAPATVAAVVFMVIEIMRINGLTGS
jgi:hypothetical protein